MSLLLEWTSGCHCYRSGLVDVTVGVNVTVIGVLVDVTVIGVD